MEYANEFDKAYICDSQGNVISSGYVWSNNDDHLELRGSSFCLFDQGAKINVNIETKAGVKETISAYVCVSQENYMSLLTLYKTTDYNKRNYFRVKTNIKSKINYQIIEQKSVPTPQPIDICILNISLGGMLIGCAVDLEAENVYKADINLNNTFIDISIKIARKFESKKWVNEYGCEFLSVSPQNEREICKYIFDLERQKLLIAQEFEQ